MSFRYSIQMLALSGFISIIGALAQADCTDAIRKEYASLEKRESEYSAKLTAATEAMKKEASWGVKNLPEYESLVRVHSASFAQYLEDSQFIEINSKNPQEVINRSTKIYNLTNDQLGKIEGDKTLKKHPYFADDERKFVLQRALSNIKRLKIACGTTCPELQEKVNAGGKAQPAQPPPAAD